VLDKKNFIMVNFGMHQIKKALYRNTKPFLL
jgi:hypothetical protein